MGSTVYKNVGNVGTTHISHVSKCVVLLIFYFMRIMHSCVTSPVIEPSASKDTTNSID